MKQLLLNFFYYNPVGHCVEGLKYAKGLLDTNADLEISIVLNNRTATELAEACNFLKAVYKVDEREINMFRDSAACIKRIPLEWDFYIWDNRPQSPSKNEMEEAFLRFADYCKRKLKVKEGIGTLFPMTLPAPMKYTDEACVDIQLPDHAKGFANKYQRKGEKFCIMLSGGSVTKRYCPSLKSWIRIINAINKNHPECTIYLLGARKSAGNERSYTAAFSEEEIKSLLSRFDNIIDCYDLGLWNQLAIIKQSNIFISPHTGFGMVVLCIGKPWLTLSGGDWPEYFFNKGVPFYSVFPNDKDYPHAGRTKYSSWQKASSKNWLFSKIERRINNIYGRLQIPSFREKRVAKKIPEIINAIRLLLSSDFTYETAFKTHLSNLRSANIDH